MYYFALISSVLKIVLIAALTQFTPILGPIYTGVKTSRDGSLGTATELQVYTVGLRFLVGAIDFSVFLFSVSSRPALWLIQLLSNGYRGLYPAGAPTSRMLELYLHFPMSSWRGTT
jgi:hypothetical protein